nr:MFS transporter [Nonomuraea guangzhouensis]
MASALLSSSPGSRDLTMTAITPLSGWLLDRLGGRATWMCALAVCLGGSVLCGLAWDLPSLIGFRVFQGLGAGLIIPALMTLLTQAAGQQRLMTARGSFSLLVQIGPSSVRSPAVCCCRTRAGAGCSW